MTFTFFLREESGAGRHICVFLPPEFLLFSSTLADAWAGVRGTGSKPQAFWILSPRKLIIAVTFEALLSPCHYSKHVTCIDSFNPHTSSRQ